MAECSEQLVVPYTILAATYLFYLAFRITQLVTRKCFTKKLETEYEFALGSKQKTYQELYMENIALRQKLGTKSKQSRRIKPVAQEEYNVLNQIPSQMPYQMANQIPNQTRIQQIPPFRKGST